MTTVDILSYRHFHNDDDCDDDMDDDGDEDLCSDFWYLF